MGFIRHKGLSNQDSEKGDTMKTTSNEIMFYAIATLIGSASSVFAAPGGDNAGSGILLTAFLTFGALILVFQLVPGMILFFSMMKGLFVSSEKEKAVVISEENGKNH
jgi:hypothetical protein